MLELQGKHWERAIWYIYMIIDSYVCDRVGRHANLCTAAGCYHAHTLPLRYHSELLESLIFAENSKKIIQLLIEQWWGTGNWRDKCTNWQCHQNLEKNHVCMITHGMVLVDMNMLGSVGVHILHWTSAYTYTRMRTLSQNQLDVGNLLVAKHMQLPASFGQLYNCHRHRWTHHHLSYIKTMYTYQDYLWYHWCHFTGLPFPATSTMLLSVPANIATAFWSQGELGSCIGQWNSMFAACWSMKATAEHKACSSIARLAIEKKSA